MTEQLEEMGVQQGTQRRNWIDPRDIFYGDDPDSRPKPAEIPFGRKPEWYFSPEYQS